jgi:hypothetical protein
MPDKWYEGRARRIEVGNHILQTNSFAAQYKNHSPYIRVVPTHVTDSYSWHPRKRMPEKWNSEIPFGFVPASVPENSTKKSRRS